MHIDCLLTITSMDSDCNEQIFLARLGLQEKEVHLQREPGLNQTPKLQVEDQKRPEDNDNQLIQANEAIRALRDEVQTLQQQLDQQRCNFFKECVEPCVQSGTVPSDCRPSEPESGSSDAGTSHKHQDIMPQDIESQKSPRFPLETNFAKVNEDPFVQRGTSILDCRPSEPEPGSSDAGTSHKDQDVTSQDITSQGPLLYPPLELNIVLTTDSEDCGTPPTIVLSCTSEDGAANAPVSPVDGTLGTLTSTQQFEDDAGDGWVISLHELKLPELSVELLDCRDMLGPDGVYKVQTEKHDTSEFRDVDDSLCNADDSLCYDDNEDDDSDYDPKGDGHGDGNLCHEEDDDDDDDDYGDYNPKDERFEDTGMFATAAEEERSAEPERMGAPAGGQKTLSWLDTDVQDVPPPKPFFCPARPPGPQLLAGAEYSHLDLFRLFISKTMMTTIVRNSNLFGARSHRGKWQPISVEDLYSYIAMVIYMGLVPLKQLRDYWRRTDLYGLSFPPSVLSGRKFDAISRTLHMSAPGDDDVNSRKQGAAGYDRLCKVRPMYEALRQACKAHFHPRQHIAIDERMVKSQARTSLRQYMPNKPTRWGYKLFVLADSSTGYTWDFFVYEGKGGPPIVRGLGYDTVMRLLDVDVLGQGYRLYVDNFYTSPGLFRDLLAKKVWACGTVRTHRTGLPRHLPGGLSSQSPRGTIRWIRDGPLLFVRWRDTRDVGLLSTIHAAHGEESSVQRGTKQDGEWSKRTIPAPPAVLDYNAHMGGVDLSDALIGSYNTLHRTKKWYRTFFYHFIDIAIVNAFILHKELAGQRQQVPLTQKEFRESLVLQLKAAGCPHSTGYPPPPPLPLAPSYGPRPSHHMPRHFSKDGTNGRRRCVHCKIKCTVECSTCAVTLCFTVNRDCYNAWHTAHNKL